MKPIFTYWKKPLLATIALLAAPTLAFYSFALAEVFIHTVFGEPMFLPGFPRGEWHALANKVTFSLAAMGLSVCWIKFWVLNVIKYATCKEGQQ